LGAGVECSSVNPYLTGAEPLTNKTSACGARCAILPHTRATNQGAGAEVDGNGKKRKRKHAKEDGQPKKARTAYIIFVTENMARVKANGGEGMKQKEVMTELGEVWRSMDDAAKAP